MDLVLWRHAEAFDAKAEQDDLERALTPKGERQAARIAEWLDRRLPDGVRILASPALRAQQTAQALGRRVRTSDAIAPGADVDALLAAAHWPRAHGTVVVVGHQPTLGLAVARLLGGDERSWSIRKGAVWWLRYRMRAGQPQVVLEVVQTPGFV
jgi:phosphohistidine phosphatase